MSRIRLIVPLGEMVTNAIRRVTQVGLKMFSTTGVALLLQFGCHGDANAAAMAAAPTSLHVQNRTLEIDDLRLEVGLSTPVLSPDGSQAKTVVVTLRCSHYRRAKKAEYV